MAFRTSDLNISEIFARELQGEVNLGKVTIGVTYTPEGNGVGVKVEPRNHRSAPIEALCNWSEGLAYLTVGAHTRMEVPLEGQRYSKLEGPEELAAIIDAVRRGEVSETLWSKGGKIVKARTSIRVDGRLLSLSNFSPFTLPFGRSKEIRDYEPY